MSLASLYNVPADAEGTNIFSFENAMHHQAVANAIVAAGGAQQPSYIIDPIPTVDVNSWLLSHQNMHNAANAALGLNGNDLTTVDFRNKEQLVDWIELHASEHVAWGQVLNV